MKHLVTLFVVAAVILLQGCHKSGNVSDSERAQMLSQIQQMLDAHGKSVESEGLQGSIKYLHNSPDFRWAYKGSSVSYDTLVSRINSDQAKYRSIRLQWDSLAIAPLTSELVSFVARYREFVRDTTGRESQLSGLVKGEVIHLSDGWKFQGGRAE
jgi:hypothetical protein